MKVMIFDSSSIITLALNNLLNILPAIKKKFGIRLFITQEIKKEAVDVPSKIKRFELESLMIFDLIKNEVLEVIEAPQKETSKILESANQMFKVNGEFIRIMHPGEASCLVVYNMLKEKKYDVLLVIDERTTRMLCENPENLRRLFEKKLHALVRTKQNNAPVFSGINIIRSSELLFSAYKKGLIVLPTTPKNAIDALLYAAKSNGCSISYEEIDEAKALV